MKPEATAALWASGADPLVVRLAMHPHIPMSYTEAHAAPISVLLQAEILADEIDRIEERRAFLAAHEAAVRKGQQGRRR